MSFHSGIEDTKYTRIKSLTWLYSWWMGICEWLVKDSFLEACPKGTDPDLGCRSLPTV